MPLAAVEPDLTLAVPVAPSVRGGFNSAIMVGSRVYGSHSELGLWVWDTAGPATGRALFESMTRNAKVVRGVCAFAGHLYCGVDDRVIRWPVDGGIRHIGGNGQGLALWRASGKLANPERTLV